MKKLLYILTLIPVLALGQSLDQNWIKTTIYKQPTTTPIANPDVTVANVQVSYFDELGRPIQQIAYKQSSSGKDIVTHIEYDSFGRQTKDYLPFTYDNQNTDFVDATTVATELTSFYSSYNGGTTNPYSEKEIEASPLNRVFKQAAPGNAWAMGSGKEIKFDYQSNLTNEVKLFTATTTWDGNVNNRIYNPVLNDLGYYSENQLYKTITKDENWTSGVNNTTEEFKNKEGQVVLKRAYNAGVAHDTYYVYDEYGNLTYVLPPLAEGVAIQSVLDNLGYQYKYDHRNRLVEKKLPGKQWEFIIYDKLDRPVATGPAYNIYGAVNENDKGWMITEYDVFGRVTQTGWKQMTVSTTDRTTHQNSVSAGSNPFVLSANDILTKNYYDDYTYPNAPQVPAQILGQDTTTSLKGLPTGSWTRVLDINNPNAAETAYTLYDDRYRPVSSYTSNHLGGYTQIDSKLDWIGKTQYTITTHKYDTNGSVITITDTFEYTDQDRLSLHKQQIGSGSEQLIAKNIYDELGQLISKKVGGQDATGASSLQTVDYNYNIRGWLKNINDVGNIGNDLFSFKISYNEVQSVGMNDIQPEALYNGNISSIYWKTKYGSLKKYNYEYDNLNRLTEAVYLKPELSINDINAYNETLSYDKNGNIQTLERNGGINAGLPNPIDDLTYTYDTNNKNLLVKVADDSTSPQGFKNGSNTGNDYVYDANGNMTIDNNKGITKIVYNHLDLPTEINFAGTDKISYIYNAIGQKVAKIVTENSTITKTHYLAGGFQYKNNALQFFPQAEGYVKKEANSYSYVFNYTDHLGNIRLSYTDTDNNGTIDIDEIVEENEYYPFGLKHESHISSNAYQMKYNGAELQTELGLNMYDMDMRDYDPAIARWVVQDPVVHYDYSPYSAFDNNPVIFIDPSGADAEGYKTADGLTNEQWMETSRPGGGGFEEMRQYSQENKNDYYNERAFKLPIKLLSQRHDYDCFPTSLRMAALFLGLDSMINDKSKRYLDVLKLIKPHKGTPPAWFKRIADYLGLKMEFLTLNGETYFDKGEFKNGIIESRERDAADFIFNSMLQGKPVVLSFWAQGMPSNMGHAGVVETIKIEETVNRKGVVDYDFTIIIKDPFTNSRQINTFYGRYDFNEKVRAIMAISKP